MQLPVSMTTADLPDFLLHVAPRRSVFIWGQPGIGKSACVEQFADAVGMECVSLLGTQLAPEDLMGVPQIVDGKTKFSPPAMIARDEPYVLFCDELNGASHDIQKAFYSLINEHRIGEFTLPEGSVVIGAGNRSEDSAIVRPMSSALVNRMVHVQLRADYRAWMQWAQANSIHPLVLTHLQTRPGHLVSRPPKHEAPYSTPRAWHMLSDVLHSYTAEELTSDTIKQLAYGLLTASHATEFTAHAEIGDHRHALTQLIKGENDWPREPDKSHHRYFMAQALRDQLIKELPAKPGQRMSDTANQLRHQAKGLIARLAEFDEEAARTILVSDSEGRQLPDWLLLEITRDLPQLASRS
jgi:MoxR-like ATPase